MLIIKSYWLFCFTLVAIVSDMNLLLYKLIENSFEIYQLSNIFLLKKENVCFLSVKQTS